MAWTSYATDLFLSIIDRHTHEPIASARISFSYSKQDTLHTFSDLQGIKKIENIAFPLYLSCGALGYHTQSILLSEKEIILKNRVAYYEIRLQKKENEINEVVVTGQAVPVLAEQSIYKVNTINAKQISERGAVTLNDALQFELNQFMSNDNILGSSLSMGGLGGQNVKILVNGVPLIGRENGNIDLTQINLSNTKRIEMIQGPMSVLYGSNAMGGVINIITQDATKKIGVKAKTYYETIGKYNFFGSIQAQKKNHQIQASLARNFFQGWNPEADSIERFLLWKPKTQYTADLNYKYQYKRFHFAYFGSLLKEKISNKGEPIITPYEGYAFDEFYKNTRMVNTVSTTISLSNSENLAFSNSHTTYLRTKNRYKKDLVSLEQIETLGIGDQDTTQFIGYNLRGSLTSTRFKNLQSTLGYEWNYEKGLSNKIANYKKAMSDLGLYASVNYQLKKWQFQPSFRYTNHSIYNYAISPALHLQFLPTSKVQFRASYARGFRSPSLKEMYLQFVDQNHTILGNDELKPEIGDHAEIGFQYDINKQWRLSYTSMYNNIHNMIVLAMYNNHAVLRRYMNIESYSNFINSIQLAYRLKSVTANAGLSYSYIPASGFVPQHEILEINASFSYLIKRINTSCNISYKYTSSQPFYTIENDVLFTKPIHYGIINFQRKFWSDRILISSGIKNLFNIQNSTLSGTYNSIGGHNASSGALLFPARSVYLDMQIAL
ncbi:MAG: TonB-dependent receptor [Chitinophagaceae bacterium]